MALGLVPLLMIAAQSGETRSDDRRDGHPVVVRTYAGCCPDSTDADRTAALLESLPEDVVLVETFTGCCCGDTTRVYGPSSSSDVFVPPSPITGTGPGAGYATLPPDLEPPGELRGSAPGVRVTPPVTAEPPLSYTPVDYPLPSPPAQAGLPGWLGVLATPVLFLAGEFSDGEPDEVLCPDSGLPTGPNRPRC